MRKRKEEAYSSHVYKDTKSGDKQLRPYIDIGGIYNCVIKFRIGISDQTINYVITRNPRN